MSAARARGAGPAAVALLTPGSEGGRPAAKLVVKALGTLTSGVTPAARFLLREKGQPRHLREHATSGLRHGRVQRWAGPPDTAALGRPDLLPPRVLGCRSSAWVQAASPRQVCRWQQLSSPLHTWRRVRVRVPRERGCWGNKTLPSPPPAPPVERREPPRPRRQVRPPFPVSGGAVRAGGQLLPLVKQNGIYVPASAGTRRGSWWAASPRLDERPRPGKGRADRIGPGLRGGGGSGSTSGEQRKDNDALRTPAPRGPGAGGRAPPAHLAGDFVRLSGAGVSLCCQFSNPFYNHRT